MKKFIILLILLNVTSYSHSQELDKVYLKNKEVISGKILQVTSENIEVDPEGSKPFLIIKRDNVKLIIYSDNTIVSFEDTKVKTKTSNKSSEFESNILIDDRDGEQYKIGKIGNQVWMLENLRFKTENSFEYDREKYGLSYMFSDALKVCPNGWHLPSNNDFEILINELGGKKKAKHALKSIDGWKKNKGTNSSGFNALPGGIGNWKGMVNYYQHNKVTGKFIMVGKKAAFWVIDGTNNDSVMFKKTYLAQDFEIDIISTIFYSRFRYYALSCRCIKDN